jgi:hypothetical protein
MDEEIRKKYFSHVIDKPKKEKTTLVSKKYFFMMLVF